MQQLPQRGEEVAPNFRANRPLGQTEDEVRETQKPKGPVERPVRPLSKTQSELLEAMKAGVIIHFMPYMGRFNPNSYYFRGGTSNRCTAAAEALIAKGFAKRIGGYNRERLVLIDRA